MNHSCPVLKQLQCEGVDAGWSCAVTAAVFGPRRTLSPSSSAESRQLPSDEKLQTAAGFLRFQKISSLPLSLRQVPQTHPPVCLVFTAGRWCGTTRRSHLGGSCRVFSVSGRVMRSSWWMMNNYIFIRVVGKGSYGEVHLVKHRSDRKQVRHDGSGRS